MASPYATKGKRPYLYLYPSCKHAASTRESGVTTDTRGNQVRYDVMACTRCHIITKVNSSYSAYQPGERNVRQVFRSDD